MVKTKTTNTTHTLSFNIGGAPDITVEAVYDGDAFSQVVITRGLTAREGKLNLSAIGHLPRIIVFNNNNPQHLRELSEALGEIAEVLRKAEDG